VRSVVQVYLGPPRNSGVPGSTDTRAADDRRMPRGGVAQLGERLVCNQEAIGSIPFTSTILPLEERRRAEVSGLGAKYCAPAL
jgi:hypothetical protein